MVHGSGLHHLDKRKRIHQKHESYPHPNKWKRLIDRIVYIAAIIGPLFGLPQVIKIWVEKSTAGVSILTWAALIPYQAVWLLYGIIHKEKPIILVNILWIIIEAFVVAGMLIHG